MRVVILAPHFAEYATRLAVALQARADVLLVTEKTNRDSECAGLRFDGPFRHVAQAGFKRSAAMNGPSVRRFLAFRKICRRIAAFRPDVIHVQEQGDDFTASIVERFAGLCPIVLTVHDPVPHSGNDALVAARFAGGLARLRTAAAAYHVHGTYCATALRQRLATSKPVAATAHGLILVPAADQRAAAEDRLLFFGRMEAYKGLDTLLDAIELLDGGSGLRFVLAGRGPELERLRGRIAARPEIETVDKFLPPAEAIRQFQRARAVVAPYRDATQSGVLSAAFGNGRPAIASRVGGLTESVLDGTSGLLVPAGDPSALAAAIRRMSDPAVSAALTEGAQAAAAERFGWERVADSLLDLYADLLGGAGASAAIGTGR